MSPLFFAIPSASVFKVEGADATRYLHARLSNDIKALTPGKFCSAAMLTAQGKTEGLFTVLARPAGTYLLVSEDGERKQLEAALKRYIVADRVTVTAPDPHLALLHLIGPRESLLAAGYDSTAQLTERNGQLFYPAQRSAELGIDLLHSSPQTATIASMLSRSGFLELNQAQQELLRIRAGVPKYPNELNEETVISEAGAVSSAISFSKGCYVGQEVVEKVAAIGRLSRKLMRLRIFGELPCNQSTGAAEICLEDGSPIGRVISFAFDPALGQTFAFATLKNVPAVTERAVVTIGNLRGEVL